MSSTGVYPCSSERGERKEQVAKTNTGENLEYATKTKAVILNDDEEIIKSGGIKSQLLVTTDQMELLGSTISSSQINGITLGIDLMEYQGEPMEVLSTTSTGTSKIFVKSTRYFKIKPLLAQTTIAPTKNRKITPMNWYNSLQLYRPRLLQLLYLR